MNWLEIDAIIISMMPIYNDKDKLYTDLKKKFSWNDSQVAAATDPLLLRYDWYNMPKSQKRVTTKKSNKKATQ